MELYSFLYTIGKEYLPITKLSFLFKSVPYDKKAKVASMLFNLPYDKEKKNIVYFECLLGQTTVEVSCTEYFVL